MSYLPGIRILVHQIRVLAIGINICHFDFVWRRW